MIKLNMDDYSSAMILPFSYEELEGKSTALPLNQYQLLCMALEILERHGLCDEPGCVDFSANPDLGAAYYALSSAVVAHEHWRETFNICKHIQDGVRARFLTYAAAKA